MSIDIQFLLLSLLDSVKAPMNNSNSQNGKSRSDISLNQLILCQQALLPIFINYALIGQQITNNTILIFKTQFNYFTTKKRERRGLSIPAIICSHSTQIIQHVTALSASHYQAL
jgi:thymidine kinase